MESWTVLTLVLVFAVAAVAAAVVAIDARRRLGAVAPDPGGAAVPAMAERLAGVGEQLVELRGLVGELQRDRAAQGSALEVMLRELTSTHRDLTTNTDALRQALANPKRRGQWGERMAEDVLRAAGFVEGVNYHRQRAIAGGGIPDFAFVLPEGLELRMDVKFPIDNYLRSLEAADEAEGERRAKAFLADVRARIGELDGRGYIDARDTVDCMLLFIPNEAVYAFMHDRDPDLLDVALSRKVVLCSPSNLFAVLAVVRRAVEQFNLARTSDEILRCLGAVTDEWDRYAAALDKLGKQLGTVQRTFDDEVNGRRRRAVERHLARVDELGSGAAGDGGPTAMDDPPRLDVVGR